MKTAIVTGTTSGLGLEIANHFLSIGWKVYGLSRGSSKIVNDRYHHLRGDIKNSESIKNLIQCNVKETIDLLVNNSAVFDYNCFEDTSLDVIDNIIDTNIKGTIYVTKFILPLMSKMSKIIFINSVAGLEEIENQSIYCASKYALTSFAGVLGKEIQKKQIKVTSIHPGGINTPLWDDTDFHKDVTKLLDPKQIVETIEFICNSRKNVEYKTVKIFPDIEWH